MIRKILATISILAVDQISKRIAIQYGSRIIYENFLNIHVMWNKGISFGMGKSFHSTFLKFTVFLSCLAVVISWYKTKNKFDSKAYSFILGGGISNFIDRLTSDSGAVLDFISIKLFGINMPVFNIADISISIGFLMLFWKIILNKK
ncbi:signal peptidase II [Candidatus Nesciobacter abundans]|uniref:Lipoprotein signal peptidase n=1 Tax=Candidatus Nesciobacter abundans TaxID=2601668 RepID=A0A5C0UGS3_9PROT|nr:signal peptidase II [Candidatus Nesciobacter abundans]QEK39009.1 signal peptidase II [Candidatus Nesciobacter abundans]